MKLNILVIFLFYEKILVGFATSIVTEYDNAQVSTSYPMQAAFTQFGLKSGKAMLSDFGGGPDDVLLVDTHGHCIWLLKSNGEQQVIAGVHEESGNKDGPLGTGQLKSPHGVDMDPQGRLLIADSGNNAIRALEMKDGFPHLVTLVGDGHPGFVDGSTLEARLSNPSDVRFMRESCTVEILDSGNGHFRLISGLDPTIINCGSPEDKTGEGSDWKSKVFNVDGEIIVGTLSVGCALLASVVGYQNSSTISDTVSSAKGSVMGLIEGRKNNVMFLEGSTASDVENADCGGNSDGEYLPLNPDDVEGEGLYLQDAATIGNLDEFRRPLLARQHGSS